MPQIIIFILLFLNVSIINQISTNETMSFSVTRMTGRGIFQKVFLHNKLSVSVSAGFIQLESNIDQGNALSHPLSHNGPIKLKVQTMMINTDVSMRIKKNTTKCRGCLTSAASNRILCKSPTLESRQLNQSLSLAEGDITAYKVSGKVTKRKQRHRLSRWLVLFLDSNRSR